MTELRKFTKLPSAWIERGGLKEFRWGPQGSDNIAALMLLIVIAHHADGATGIARLSYAKLSEMASISRAKVSAGLRILMDRRILEARPDGRGSYRLANYDPERGWAMFPARGLYRNDAVEAFTEFRLRRRAELDALKLYLLFAARRSRETNMAKIGYDKIEDYAGVSRNYIRPALSVLSANHLVHVEHVVSNVNEFAIASAYRLAHLETRRHMATTGRGDDFELDMAGSEPASRPRRRRRRHRLIRRTPSSSALPIRDL